MKYCFFLILSFSCSFSPNIYFGLPSSEEKLRKGDVIIINIPSHSNIRYNPSKEMDMLIDFLNKDLGFHYTLEFNTFLGTKYNSKYSEGLSKQLEQLLEINCPKRNYTIKSNGDKNPIFLNSESPRYKKINTRIEILIE